MPKISMDIMKRKGLKSDNELEGGGHTGLCVANAWISVRVWCASAGGGRLRTSPVPAFNIASF